MAEYKGKYKGAEVDDLLDKVASGGTIYIWEFNGSLEDGATGTIEREVLEKLAEAKSLWLRHEGSYTVCNYHVGDSSSVLFMLFTTIQQDVMSNCAITIDGETLQYNVAGYEISIQDAIFDLDDIRSGAEKGATALQAIPDDVVRSSQDGIVELPRGILADNHMGMWYALPLSDDADKEDADAILAWYSPSGNLVLRRGILTDDNVGHLYALPYASDEDKAEADSVIASEAYVDDKLDGKQPTLVSGENIKTINGESILGSGNIEIGGGGGSSGGEEDDAPKVIQLDTIGEELIIEEEAIYYIVEPLTGYCEIYADMDYHKTATIVFQTGSTPPTIGFLGAFWANGIIPTIEPNTRYELSIYNSPIGVNATLVSFKNVD